MTPDARVQEAVDLMRRLGTDGEQPVTNRLIEAGLAYHERTFVYGYLAASAETERLRSALQRADDTIAMLIPEVQQTYSRDQIKADARAVRAEIAPLLTPTRDPR